MGYIGTSINDSSVIVGSATAALTDAAFLAAKFDDNGGIVLADTAGELCLGILPAEQGDITAGEDVTVQIKECGLWKTGEAVAAGAALATDAAGKCVTAASGNFILGIALEAAAEADTVIKVQIVKAGFAA